ncbi:hypothetical protein E2C01_000372 [Portunus trituberculatus]|uniref:Uncharacterized protein n=1 Tax=Portunus trituberculatus TaxID=210409 RepID=A0A5B7CER9_PORTR|nr:hypothetical protein [Portunus trituberculatus]
MPTPVMATPPPPLLTPSENCRQHLLEKERPARRCRPVLVKQKTPINSAIQFQVPVKQKKQLSFNQNNWRRPATTRVVNPRMATNRPTRWFDCPDL